MPSLNTINHNLNDACQLLQTVSPSPAADASRLLCFVLDCNSAHLIAWPEKELTPQQAAGFAELLKRRLIGEPIAYITGAREFWSLPLKVNQDVLIPRPETETLVEFVVDRFAERDGIKTADLGTGSGAIACALATERPQWDIVATDISHAALQIARSNANMLKLDNIRFCQGNWFEAIAGDVFDLIISNPPYVADDDHHLAEGDVRFEPELALTAGAQGLDAIQILTRQAGDYLTADGWLIVEHGYDQRSAVQDCFLQGGFEEIVQLTDLASLARVTAGRSPGSQEQAQKEPAW
ncbi:MAG: peptide chain release factor N(5)-glutamine methyltransferase [Gammaproteobacteria bacterium]|nr:peptide chain release factor N(5)-glutamine methyltransferase [Gammaproteobacteria bacterium]NNJ96102.1 peptide chain release factor N(5)-glutamine methyltransferase [Gammaproteobacteria bacterium]